MNHVPNDTLEAVDTLGRNLLASDPTVVDERLRSDLRVRTECDRTALDAGTAPATFRIERPAEAETLRGHGSFVDTTVSGVETRLRQWGIDPPGRASTRKPRTAGRSAPVVPNSPDSDCCESLPDRLPDCGRSYR